MGVKTDYYALDYDAGKNRIYFHCFGRWSSRSVAPDFLKDWQKVMAQCKPGWSILGDLRKVEELSDDAQQWHVEVQQAILDRGVRKVAQVAPFEVAGTVRKFSQESGLQKVLWAFMDIASAELWLDDELDVGFG